MSDASSFRSHSNQVPDRPEEHPLGLTVHSLPTPQEAVAGTARRTVLGRWKMLAVLLTCAAPVIASYFTYYVVRPQSRGNFGELIDPQRPLPDQAVVSADGQPSNLRAMKGQWLLVSAAGGACDEACQKHLYLQRQLRETLGKEKDRVDWVWLVTDDAPIPDALRPALKGATVLRVSELQLSQWLSPAVGHMLQEHLYVVDPMGNWMMRFPAGL
ncbi:MAG: hypothetical protein H7293_15695, partial [Candidatus Saccharibacteria bacterium]|nr:hypothetical protein [Rhodoferax sp.]